MPSAADVTSILVVSMTHQRLVNGLHVAPRCHVLPRRPTLPLAAGCTRLYSVAKARQDPLPQELDLSLASAQGSGTSCRGRSILLTGGTSGIGLAVAQQLVRAGAGRVLILTRDADRGVQAIERIRSSTGLKDAPVSALAVDITSTADVQGPISQAIKRMACNTFIASAGMTQTSFHAASSAEADERIINTNLLSTMQLGRVFLRQYIRSGKDAMSTQPSYCFVALSSLLAIKSGAGASAYAASKAGLLAFTRAISLEAGTIYKKNSQSGPAFRANVLLPGYVDTPMTSSFSQGQKRQLMDQTPLGRFATPSEVADAVMFLTTNEYANNTVLNLDGGLSAT